MTKQQYRQARRLIRDNGRSAYAWIAQQMGGDWTMAEKLRDLADEQDWLAERADIVRWCKRTGSHCTPAHTRPPREYQKGKWLGLNTLSHRTPARNPLCGN